MSIQTITALQAKELDSRIVALRYRASKSPVYARLTLLFGPIDTTPHMTKDRTAWSIPEKLLENFYRLNWVAIDKDGSIILSSIKPRIIDPGRSSNRVVIPYLGDGTFSHGPEVLWGYIGIYRNDLSIQPPTVIYIGD
jgi:hypothetical protein